MTNLSPTGLDSLMGAEIENSLESAIGVGLPPTSDARTNRQPDRRLDCRSHGRRIRSGSIIGIPPAERRRRKSRCRCLSNEEIDKLLEGQAGGHEALEIDAERPQAMPS